MVEAMRDESGLHCDICGEPIKWGERYSITTIPKEKKDLFSFLNEQNADIAPTYTIQPNGDVRLDICLDCVLSMGISPKP